MSRVLTNNVGLAYAVESSIGTLPGSPSWRTLEPNSIGAYGASITTTERRPISPIRGRRKGTVTDLDSTAEFEADLTLDAFEDFAEGFVFAEFANVEFDLTTDKINGAALDTDTTADTFDLASGDFDATTNGTTLRDKLTYSASGAISLLYARGYANSVNNGIHPIAAVPAGSDTGISVSTNLTTETAPAGAVVEVCGVRVTDGDLTLGAPSGGVATLTSAADVSDWATLGVRAGMIIHIGSAAADGTVQNALSDAAADDTFGYARVQSVASNVLTLDKLGDALDSTANNTSDGVADVLFGRFLRNVATTADSNDSRYLERSYQFEATYPDLGGAGTDEYEYAVGNFANELALNIPLTEKATASWGFIGTNSDDITPTRKSGAASAVDPIRTTALNTSSDVLSLTTDVVSSASDVCFKSLTLTLGNNVSPEKCVGTLGAQFVNTGLFEVNLEGQMLFTRKEIVNAIKNNTTVTFKAILRNQDGAIGIDLPSLTFGGGDREFPVDASVLVNITGLAFNDPDGTIPDVSLGISILSGVPYA